MEIFGVGPAELVLILIIVLIVFGPDQLPEIAKKLGGGVRELRRNLDAISSEVDDTVKPFKELMDPNQPAPPSQPNLIVAPGAENEIIDYSKPATTPESKTEPVGDSSTAPELPRDDSSQP
jgi:sec-independent protein translocase protein TatA